MSSIGRIFIVINLALSAAFLGWAGAILAKSSEYRQKYETEVASHSDTKKSGEETKTRLSAERDEAKTTLASLREEKGRVEAERDRLNTDLATARSDNAQLRGAVDGINGKIGDFQKNLDAANARVAELDKDREKLRGEREAAVAAQTSAENEKANALEELGRTKQTVESMKVEVASLAKDRDKVTLQRDQVVALSGVSLEKVLAQPFVEAHVLEVLKDAGLVALNVGQDDGVAPGFSFEVYKGSTYKGKVVVDKVEKKMSSARIAHTAKNQSIEKGDLASTRLP